MRWWIACSFCYSGLSALKTWKTSTQLAHGIESESEIDWSLSDGSDPSSPQYLNQSITKLFSYLHGIDVWWQEKRMCLHRYTSQSSRLAPKSRGAPLKLWITSKVIDAVPCRLRNDAPMDPLTQVPWRPFRVWQCRWHCPELKHELTNSWHSPPFLGRLQACWEKGQPNLCNHRVEVNLRAGLSLSKQNLVKPRDVAICELKPACIIMLVGQEIRPTCRWRSNNLLSTPVWITTT